MSSTHTTVLLAAVREGDARVAGRRVEAVHAELRFSRGLDLAEAAEAPGVSLRTAGRRWDRAEAHLRSLLA